MRDALLLLTATIEPRNMTAVNLADPTQRRVQYLKAVQFWLRDPSRPRVILVENSGADLSNFHELASREPDRLEIIGLPHEPFPVALGKGYGEFRMVDAAVTRSRQMASATWFAKLTGRLTLTNLATLTNRLPKHFDLVADAHIVPHVANGGVVDTRLLFLSTRFYRSQVMGIYRQMDDHAGRYAEHTFFRLMSAAPAESDIRTRLPAEPRWRGVSGSTGQRYDDFTARAKWPAKVVRRQLDRLLGRPSLERIRAVPRQT
jgi:hypothetical protein